MTRTNFQSLRRLACFMFLALAWCGQFYQSSHLHHFHINDSVAFEVGSHPLAPEAAVTSTHHTHEERSSHEDEDDHKYENKDDWRVSRSKSATNLTFDPPGLLLPSYSLPHSDSEKIKFFLQAPPCKEKHHTPSLFVRGPPQLA